MQKTLTSHTSIDNVSITSTLNIFPKKVHLTFMLNGEIKNYIVPNKEKLKRANELWKTTCFELFLANSKEEKYYELNISPTLAWNFYTLSEYRAVPKEVAEEIEPLIMSRRDEENYEITFELESKTVNFEAFDTFNLACILLSNAKKRTFWSLNPQHGLPDFHNQQSFSKL